MNLAFGATIVLASSNPGKLVEIETILAPTGLKVRPQTHFNVPQVAETGSTFIENAIIKARQASRVTGLPALADDSGLCVDALDGEPGVHSARYAGENASDADNVHRLLAALKDVPEGRRTARFQCVIVVMRHAKDPIPLISAGTWEGAIQTEASGYNGFGYDPVFHVPNYNCSAAELDPGTKNQLSHRGKAVALLRQQIGTIF